MKVYEPLAFKLIQLLETDFAEIIKTPTSRITQKWIAFTNIAKISFSDTDSSTDFTRLVNVSLLDFFSQCFIQALLPFTVYIHTCSLLAFSTITVRLQNIWPVKKTTRLSGYILLSQSSIIISISEIIHNFINILKNITSFDECYHKYFS